MYMKLQNHYFSLNVTSSKEMTIFLSSFQDDHFVYIKITFSFFKLMEEKENQDRVITLRILFKPVNNNS